MGSEMCIRDRDQGNPVGSVRYARQLPQVPGQLAAHLVLGIGLHTCLLYTSDAADERSSVDLGGRRIIKKKDKYIKS